MENTFSGFNQVKSPISEMPMPKKKNKTSIFGALSKLIPGLRVSVFLIFLVQLIILYLFLNPVNLLQQLSVVNVINEVSKLTSVPPTEVPSVIAVIGDKTNLPDINTIKNQNSFNAKVYANAQNGDYVIAYTNKMIIYRRSTNEIIYNGDSPVALQNQEQTQLANAIVKLAKENDLISNDSTEIPQLSIVNEVEKLKEVNATFYKNVAKDDIVAIFPIASKILIYRQSTNSLVNGGDYTFIIK